MFRDIARDLATVFSVSMENPYWRAGRPLDEAYIREILKNAEQDALGGVGRVHGYLYGSFAKIARASRYRRAPHDLDVYVRLTDDAYRYESDFKDALNAHREQLEDRLSNEGIDSPLFVSAPLPWHVSIGRESIMEFEEEMAFLTIGHDYYDLRAGMLGSDLARTLPPGPLLRAFRVLRGENPEKSDRFIYTSR